MGNAVDFPILLKIANTKPNLTEDFRSTVDNPLKAYRAYTFGMYNANSLYIHLEIQEIHALCIRDQIVKHSPNLFVLFRREKVRMH